MFEGKPPKAGSAPLLQPVTWADLSSRLAAARDLRKALADDAGGEGSFDAASARWIADHATQEGAGDGEGQPDVNPDDLGNGKAVEGMAGFAMTQPTSGDRGKE